MSVRIRLGHLCILLITLFMLVPVVQADMGPKPTMSFEFEFETDEPLGIVEATLYQCEDPSCADAEPLEDFGPQHFSCTVSTCSSMSYGYSTFNQLEISFTDGVIRQSQIFSKEYFEAQYRVTVRSADMQVEELEGKTSLWNLFTIGGIAVICVAGIMYTAVAILLVFLWRQEGKDSLSFQEAPILFILVSVLASPIILLTALFARTVFLTLLIECGLILIYARYRKRPLIPLGTICLLANLLSQPLLWFILLSGGVSFSFLILGVELVIVLLEAGVLFATRYKSMTFREALVISLVLNLVSFGIGLLLSL